MLVIVTGASRGIGYEIVRNLSGQAGITVIAVSRNIRPVEAFSRKSAGSGVIAVNADITTVEGRKKIHAAVKKTGKKLNILINNAGLLVNKPFHKISEKELQEVYAANVFGPFQLTQTLLPLFSASLKSHIVNISSMGGFQGTMKFAGLSAYSSSKAALCGLTECMAEEFKLKNIAVNCLAIGAVQTEMLKEAFPGYKAPISAKEMAAYISDFALNGSQYFNGKIIPVSLSTP